MEMLRSICWAQPRVQMIGDTVDHLPGNSALGETLAALGADLVACCAVGGCRSGKNQSINARIFSSYPGCL